jgi:hypothetical protein
MGICKSKDAKREKEVAPEQHKDDANGKPGPAVIQDQSSTQPPTGPPAKPPVEQVESKPYELVPPGEEHSESEERDDFGQAIRWDRECSTWEAHNLATNYPSK